MCLYVVIGHVVVCVCMFLYTSTEAEYCDYESINQSMTILKPFSAGNKQISVVILQPEVLAAKYI